MIRRALVTMLAVSALFGFVTGCEWSGSGSDGTWSDQYSWVNFSGVYKPYGASLLVQSHAYAAATSAGSNSAATVRRSVTETIGTGTGASRSFSTTLSHVPVASGSVFVTDGFEAFQDVPTPGTLAGDKGGTGSVNYNTGAISVTFNLDPGAGVAIRCTYEYDEAVGSGSGTSSSSASNPQGSSLAVYSLSVFQQGNLLDMTDNNGATYKGKMGSLVSSGGATQGQVADGSTVTAQFTASGISANGRGIKIVGTLQGRYQAGTSSGSSGSSGSGTATTWLLTSRTMQATWIEDGGVFTGDITAVAPTAPVTVSTSTSTNNAGL